MRYQHYSALSPSASALFQGGFTRHETTRLKVSGQALETIKIDGEIFQSDVDFDNRYYIRMATTRYELFLGEFQASLQGSEFTLFNRNLQGAKLTGEIPLSDEPAPRIEFTFIGSSPRGRTAYEKFFGTDTQGPYQLSAFPDPVVLDSEQILVDGVKQIRNVDYEINYITGQVTFKRRIVETRSLIEATYEVRSSLYPRALYGGQVKYQITDYDAISLIGLDERDNKDRQTFDFSGTPPSAHTVLGSTYKHDGEFLRYGGEYAHSFFDPNRFEGGLDHGNAYKGEMEVERFGLLLGGDIKRVEPRYRTLGNTALGRDFLGWSTHGGLGLGRALKLSGRHRQHRTLLNGSPNELRATDAKAVFTPKGWPRESYRFYQSDETFASNYDRLERRHTVDVSHKINLPGTTSYSGSKSRNPAPRLDISSGYERQDITFRDGAQPNRRWDAGKASLGLRNLSWLAASLNGEVRRGRESSSVFTDSKGFQTVIGAANIGWTPHERYYLGGTNRWQQTTGRPAQNTLRTQAKAQPIDQLSADASFSQETLQMFYVTDLKDARTNSYAALVEAKPLKSLAFLYQPSLRETVLGGIRPAANANRREIYTVKWALRSWVSTEGNYSVEDFRLRDTSDPGLRVQTSQDTDTWDVSLRLAPTPAFSSEVSYSDKTSNKQQLNLFSPGLYDSRDTRQQIMRIGLRPQLEAKLGVDAGYRFERFKQQGSQGVATTLPGYTISPVEQQIQRFSLINNYTQLFTHEHTVNTGASYQWTKRLISTATLAYDLKQDRLGIVPTVETLAASNGLTFRIKRLKIEGTYRLAQSRGGADTRQQAFSGGLDFTPASQVRWTTRVEYSISANPATVATDVTSSLEVSF